MQVQKRAGLMSVEACAVFLQLLEHSSLHLRSQAAQEPRAWKVCRLLQIACEAFCAVPCVVRDYSFPAVPRPPHERQLHPMWVHAPGAILFSHHLLCRA